MGVLDVMTLVIILVVAGTAVAFFLWLASVPGKVARHAVTPRPTRSTSPDG
jgi:hypothetical protein